MVAREGPSLHPAASPAPGRTPRPLSRAVGCPFLCLGEPERGTPEMSNWKVLVLEQMTSAVS